jgi:hypothetical protein
MDSTLMKFALVTRRYGLEANGMEVLETRNKERQYPSPTRLCLLGANEQELMRQSEELISVSLPPCKWSSLMTTSNCCTKVHSESSYLFVVESR